MKLQRRQPFFRIPAAPARVATGKAIDLSALRAFDATLNLETSALELSSLKVLYGDMTASLRNGVLKISRLTGQFYGGAVDFVGTVDASKASMSAWTRPETHGTTSPAVPHGTSG